MDHMEDEPEFAKNLQWKREKQISRGRSKMSGATVVDTVIAAVYTYLDSTRFETVTAREI